MTGSTPPSGFITCVPPKKAKELPAIEAFADILSHDAVLIYRLAAKLPGRTSKELYRLYKDLELPLMLLLDNMRRVGIGVDGETCAREKLSG